MRSRGCTEPAGFRSLREDDVCRQDRARGLRLSEKEVQDMKRTTVFCAAMMGAWLLSTGNAAACKKRVWVCENRAGDICLSGGRWVCVIKARMGRKAKPQR